LPLIVRVYLQSNFSGELHKTHLFCKIAHQLFKVTQIINFGMNRKRVCNFLLVCHSNLVSILHRFRDIAGFCVDDNMVQFWGVFPLD